MDVIEIPLKHGIALVDANCWDLIKDYTWLSTKKKKGTSYVVAHVPDSGHFGKNIYLHRLLKKFPKGKLVDHKNGNGLDNRMENLRVCSIGQNARNQRKTRGGSKFKGVSWDSVNQKWRVSIAFQGKSKNLGRFSNELDAARAYDKAALIFHGEFARINGV